MGRGGEGESEGERRVVEKGECWEGRGESDVKGEGMGRRE